MVPGIFADVFNDLTPQSIRQFKVSKEEIILNLKDSLFYSREL
jgi:hypothetical protein